MPALLKGTLAGGLVAFVWSMVAWTALPFHFSVLNTVENEPEMAQSIKSHITQPGMYVVPNPNNPSMDSHHQKMKEGPYAYMMVIPEGFMPSMPGMMGKGLLLHLLIAFMLTWLLSKTSGLDFKQKVGFVTVAALCGGAYAHLAYANWWFFPLDYTLIYLVLDAGLGWALAGAAIAKVTN